MISRLLRLTANDQSIGRKRPAFVSFAFSSKHLDHGKAVHRTSLSEVAWDPRLFRITVRSVYKQQSLWTPKILIIGRGDALGGLEVGRHWWITLGFIICILRYSRKKKIAQKQLSSKILNMSEQFMGFETAGVRQPCKIHSCVFHGIQRSAFRTMDPVCIWMSVINVVTAEKQFRQMVRETYSAIVIKGTKPL